MPNVLEYAKIFQTQLDKQVVAGATSGWMEVNSNMVKYNGGNEVKIPKIVMDGLGDYDRNNGFAEGSVTLEFETMQLTQDRGRTFQLDRMDVDETAFVATAGVVMGEFQRTKVIPEIDAYRYSKMATLAIENGRATGGYTADPADILKRIKADIAEVQDIAGDVQLVISLPYTIANILENSDEIRKQLSVIDFKQGELNTKVTAIDVHPIIKVPSARMKTSYVFNDGKTAGQTAGGFVAAPGAKSVNWMICSRQCPIAVSKTDNPRIFDPATNQKADAWKIDYRKYHDLWVPDNMLTYCKVNIKEALV